MRETQEERHEAAKLGWEHRREHDGKIVFACPSCAADVTADDDECAGCAFPVHAYVVKKRLAEVEQREADDQKAKEQELAKHKRRRLIPGVM